MMESELSDWATSAIQLIIREADLLNGSEEEISWIWTEFRVMVAFLQSIDALDQPPGNSNDLVDQTRKVIRETQDLIQTYVERQRQLLRTPVYLRPISSVKLPNLSEKPRQIKQQIIQVRQQWKNVHLAADSQHLPGSSCWQSKCTAMIKLESALQVRNLDSEVLECIKWVRDELAPLHDFLREIDNVPVLGERQKIWIQELKGIFQFIDESFAEEKGAEKRQSIFLRCGVSNFYKIHLRDVVSESQDKILQLYRRYYAYGFGKIMVDNDSRSILPRIRMRTPIPAVSRSDIFPMGLDFLINDTLGSMWSPFGRPSERTMAYLSLPTRGASIELLRVDLKLMKALIEDSRSMGDLDGRAGVWLSQLQEIAVDLEALDEHASSVRGGIKGVFDKLHDQSKLDRIACEIHDIVARKMTYGIGSALGEAGMPDSIAAILVENQLHQMPVDSPATEDFKKILEDAAISKTELRRRVESVGKELQLMDALFADFRTMWKPDKGLEIWVEEMLCVAREAKAIVKLDYKSFCARNQAARRVKQLYRHIFMMFRWKHIYNIGDVKSGRIGFFNYYIREATPYPPNAIERGLEFNRREMKLIQTLYSDIEEIDKWDGTAKAWMEEMRSLTTDAKRIFRQHKVRDIRKYLSQMKDKIRQLYEIKIAYGIKCRRLPPSIVHDMKEKLLADHEKSCIIPIVGMRNTHKEALQELINNDNAINHHFDWHIWVYVPEEFCGVSISEHVGRQIVVRQKAKFLDLKSKLDTPTEEVLMQMLQEILMHKRYLMVLDEIQYIEVWHRLERAFPKISTGSRIILITNEHTCSSLKSSYRAIFDSVKLGRLPSETRSVMSGSDASKIDSLPSYLKHCLHYFLLFPAKFEIPTRRIKVLWAAQDLVRQDVHESDDDVANRYLNKLVELELVLGKRKKLNGRFKACQLDESIRETLSTTAKESGFFQGTHDQVMFRLVDHHGTLDSCFIQIPGNPKASTPLKNYRDVLSFMSFNTQEGNKPGEDLGNFLRKCISAGCFLKLRVLDLEKVFRPKLPEAICSLMLLKYLGLRWTYLEHLPKYVNKLLNLQVLDVKHTYISLLPKSIWNMQYLRHLYLSETYRTKFVGCPPDVSLDELQTLWGAYIDENTYVSDGLDTTLKIRKLGLLCRSTSSHISPMKKQLKAVNDWISNLELLEVLRLKSRDDNGKPSELHLEPLITNRKLSTVYLLGKLEPSVVSKFPLNLIDITLSGSELKIDPMISLEKLPQLRTLRLLAQSVVCKSMHCSKGGFPQLKVLKIWKLENLKKWKVEEGALPSLEILEIRKLENLKEWEVKKGALPSLKEWKVEEGALPSLKEWRVEEGALPSLKFLTVEEGALPSLEFLEIRKLENLKEWIIEEGALPSLELLEISKLENLKKWEVEEGALPSLKFLEIRSCTNLEMLPNALQHVDTLQECILASMPPQFIDKTKDRQPQLWDKIKLDPSVDQEQI
ncbi:hypothetical protein CDL12_12816 [Handroanthus impetiginosus]|uniref:Uncharacterized protein n=1 Tax=Handroanthus impetiginosus TaxID=429701 RepID=A0A2G9HAL3_9LAMI|nr:hypothetical protein CDL12_12816 [Handroanthus impetiginosus]